MLFQGEPFSNEDSQTFAALAGDFNPMHTQPVAARRFGFGGTIVHGIHTCLWAVNQLLSHRALGRIRFEALSATFSSPVRTGDSVTITCDSPPEQDRLKITVRCGGKVAQRITCVFGTAEVESWPDAPTEPPFEDIVQVLHPDDGAGLAGTDLPRLCPRSMKGLFPEIASRLPASQIAQILTTTRIVGMKCPGLSALFAGLRLRFSDSPPPELEPIEWQVKSVDPRFRLAVLSLNGGSVTGSVDAFFRPPPVQQLTMADAVAQVRADEFQGQHALIVGGSRGLGEVTAKLLAAGGARVDLSYRSGSAECEKVVAELRGHGTSVRSGQLDVLHPESSDFFAPGQSGRWTHLYYFASPHIESNSTGNWDELLFARFSQYFVSSFAKVVEATLGHCGDDGLTVIYPSTTFLSEPEPGFVEYVTAKAAGEQLALGLQNTHPQLKVHCPRLPRMLTDQTNSVTQIQALEPAPTILAFLRSLPSEEEPS